MTYTLKGLAVRYSDDKEIEVEDLDLVVELDECDYIEESVRFVPTSYSDFREEGRKYVDYDAMYDEAYDLLLAELRKVADDIDVELVELESREWD